MNQASINLQDHFLIAMPQLDDPNFTGTLTYICKHDDDGAMGIIVNKSTGIDLGDVFKQLEFETQGTHNQSLVMRGGPVQIDRGFVLHDEEGAWDSSYKVSAAIQLTTSRDILQAIALGEGPKHYVVALGYAGWGAGQLEEELAQNAWLTCVASDEILFNHDTHEKYELALASIGLDAAKLSGQAGHA